MKKFDLKYILISILLIVGFVLSHFFYDKLMCSIEWVLSLPYLILYAGALSTIFTLLSKIKKREISFNSKMSFKDFRASVGDIISFIDNPIVIVGALGLAKGLFLHYTKDVKYFPFLQNYEIVLVLLVTLYLLYISILELWNNIVETLWTEVVSKDKPHAMSKEEVQDREVPEPEE